MTWALDLARRRQASDNPPPLFGVILYTDSHPNIKKVLRDDDYWRALDEMSGPSWAIFSVRAHSGHWEFPKSDPGVMSMLVQVWKEPSANREVLAAFELSDTKDLPALVVFTLRGEALNRTVVPIDEDTLETAYASLKSVTTQVAKSLEALVSQPLVDPNQVFQAVNRSLRGYQNRKRIKDAYRVLKEVRDWLPI